MEKGFPIRAQRFGSDVLAQVYHRLRHRNDGKRARHGRNAAYHKE